MKHRTSDSNRQ